MKSIHAHISFQVTYFGAVPNDLAVLQLVDQEPGMMQAIRQLVAPYYGGVEARGYQLYSGDNERGQRTTFVGYGRTGSGNTGDRSNEVQSIAVPAGVALFRLSLDGMNFTGDIRRDASAAAVARALSGLEAIGNLNVAVQRSGDGRWTVRFVGDLGFQDVAQLQSNAVGVVVQTLREGVGTSGTKRIGQNNLDRIDGNGNLLTFDFDNGAEVNDALRNDRIGQGANEANTAPGDSGGPAFVMQGLRRQIAGVQSFGATTGTPPDIDNYVRWNGERAEPSANGTFGEIGSATRVSRFVPNFLSRTAAAGQTRPLADPDQYDLVLDMNKQVFGNDRTAGNDPLIERTTITARRVGANLELLVGNPNSERYTGTYFVGAAANIRSLTIRGSADHEIFNLEGNLGINQITVIGRDGDDTLQIVSPGDPIGAGGVSFDGGAGRNSITATADSNYTLSDVRLTISGLGDVTLQNVQYARLTGGVGEQARNNTFTVTDWTQTADLDGRGGNDTVISTNDTNFGLTNAQLTRLTGGTFGLRSIEAANLTGGGDANRFTVTGWTGAGRLDGQDGDDVVIAADNANYTLTNSQLVRFPGGALTLMQIEQADLTGGADDNTFTVSGWSGTANLDGVVGDDLVISSNNASFTLIDAQLLRSTNGATSGTFNLRSMERATLTGGGGANHFDVSGWTGDATLDGQGGTDRLIATDDTDYNLSLVALTRVGGKRVSVDRIEEAYLTGGAAANAFTLSWAGVARIDGGGGDDQLTINGGDVRLVLVNTEQLQIEQGVATLRENAAVDTFVMNGGTLAGNRGLSILRDGAWNGGAWEGTGGSAVVSIQAEAAFEIAGAAEKRLTNYELLNQGVVHWVGDSDVTAVTARISNEGGFKLLGRSRLLGDGRTTFTNASTGTLEKTGDGQSSFAQVRFANAGSVRVVDGIVGFAEGVYVQSNGSTIVEKGGSLSKTGAALDINGGVIGGDGLVLADVDNAGTLAPGGAPGHLTVVGAYRQRGNGTFEAELRNQVAARYDQLSVNNGVTLAGALKIVPLLGFNGNQFTLIQNDQPRTTPVTGTFQGLPEGAQVMVAGQAYRITYRGGDGNDVVLHKVNPGPEVQIGDVRLAEGTGDNTQFRFLVALSQASTQTVSVSYQTVNGTATAGADYQAASGAVEFAPGEVWKEIIVNVIGDAAVEADETFAVQLTGATNGAIIQEFGVGEISNDDHVPRAGDDDLVGAEDTPAVIDVLVNELDPDGGPLSVASVGPAAHGTVTINADQTVTYTPEAGFAGLDRFTYVVSDGANTASAAVYVTVEPAAAGVYLVPGRAGETTLVTFTWTEREAGYNNELFFYRVDDAQGRLGSLAPGDPAYAAAALQRALSDATIVFESGTGAGTTRSFQLAAGTLIAFGFAQNSTAAAWSGANPGNELGIQPHGFFSLIPANPDAFDLFRRTLDLFFTEDLDHGGDQDFNDIVFRIAATRS